MIVFPMAHARDVAGSERFLYAIEEARGDQRLVLAGITDAVHCMMPM